LEEKLQLDTRDNVMEYVNYFHSELLERGSSPAANRNPELDSSVEELMGEK